MPNDKPPKRPTVLVVKDTDAAFTIKLGGGKPTVTMGPIPGSGGPKRR